MRRCRSRGLAGYRQGSLKQYTGLYFCGTWPEEIEDQRTDGVAKKRVVPLDSLAGEPLQVFVNDTLLAKGDIVLIDEKYGIKLTHIVPKTERLKSSD